MLIDISLLLEAMLIMLAIALVADVLRHHLHDRGALAASRLPDQVLVDILFFVLLPATLYAWFFPLVPFGGLRAGLFFAGFLFLLAVVPSFAVFRLKAPGGAEVTLGHLFWLLLKYLAVYGALAHVYRP